MRQIIRVTVELLANIIVTVIVTVITIITIVSY